MNPDGSNLNCLTCDTPEEEGMPAWSSTGQRIAYVTATRLSNEEGDIWIMNADGSQKTPLLTNDPQSADLYPAWARDGERLAFVSNRDGNNDIYLTYIGSSKVENLTNHLGDNRGPSWSPDSKQIAFDSDRGSNRKIYIMNVETHQVTPLTDNVSTDEGFPGWSPDGKRIAFHAGVGNYNSIYIININGKGEAEMLIGDDKAYNVHAAWSPDGMYLAFHSNLGINYALDKFNIYRIKADSTGLTRMTDTATIDASPSWSRR
jgi:tol-pal system beta propeller repeat protein TolB